MNIKTNNMRTGILSLLAVFVLFSSCNRNQSENDASGAFEAVEIIVSVETMAQVNEIYVTEGQVVTAGQTALTLDSTQLYLKVKQLKASMNAASSRRPDIKKQIAALKDQIQTAEREQVRVGKLVSAGAVNTKQLDDLNAQLSVLKKQEEALTSTLQSSSNSLNGEIDALQLQVEQLEDQLSKTNVKSPVNGTILIKYIEKGETATPGKPLFKVADLSVMKLKAYVTGDQLGAIKLGQKVKVFVDFSKDEMKEYAGTLTNISSQAEFTPKTIQTKDERATQVYAVQIEVANDGYLKIGMYGEVKF